MARLEHLLVKPLYGLCNRIRVIAATRRFARITGVPCAILWDWPDYEALFEPDPEIEILQSAPQGKTYSWMEDPPLGYAPKAGHLRIPLDGPARIAITTCHFFGTMADSYYLDMPDLRAFLPTPSPRVRRKVQAFRARQFPPANITGFHIRRTDSPFSILESPDWKFFHHARAITGRGGQIYLATDNHRTEQQMLRRFPGNILIYPKNAAMAKRWPRESDIEETIDDYADLLLLASCDYVLGSSKSTYTSVAMALNGSTRCSMIEQLPLGPVTAADRRQAARDEIDKTMMRLMWLRRRLQPGIGIGRALRKVGIKLG